MHRPTSGRRSTARVLGSLLTIGLYLAVLLAATRVTAADDASQASEAVAVVAGEPAEASPRAAGAGAATESPILTIAIAGLALAMAGAWRLARVARAPRPEPLPISSGRRHVPTPG